MKTEIPNALHFIMQDDIFLLKQDREAYSHTTEAVKLTVVQDDPIETHAPVETAAIAFNYLGGNKKKFLITVHYPGIDFMADAHLIALQNTLKRLGFELDDVAILNMASYNNAEHAVLVDYFKPEKLLLMGKNALPLNTAQLKLNEIKTAGSCTMLFSFSFEEMMDSNEYKKAFWEQMKLL